MICAFCKTALHDCIPCSDSVEQTVDDQTLIEIINSFLEFMPTETRKIFMRRYWYLSPIKEIAVDYAISESKTKMTLLRTRNVLRDILEKEGITL